MENEIIDKIIEAANNAPSGGNSQPWRFVVNSEFIDIVMLPEKDHEFLNFKNRGTLIAHGALMENINIASRFFSYEPIFELYPDKNISMRVRFNKVEENVKNDLYGYIIKRCSNRKRYEIGQLSSDDKKYLFYDVSNFPNCDISISEKENINLIAKNLALDTPIFLQNKILHRLLFKEIIWKEKDQTKRQGLYVKTMEAKPPKSIVFNLLKNWSVARFFSKIKLPQKIHEENTKTISSSALLGAISVEDNDTDFIEAGRLMQNIWLRATKLGLGFQIITGVLFLWQRSHFEENDILSDSEKNIVNEAYKNIYNIFKPKKKIITIVFRLGKSDPPSAVSHKRPPIVTRI